MAANRDKTDYYAVLQVHPEADHMVIEAAYRQLMKKYHPDKAGDDPRLVALNHARAKAINEAFSVLRDPMRRWQYDCERAAGSGPITPPPAAPRPEGVARPTASQTAPPGPPPQPASAYVAVEDKSSVLGPLRSPLSAVAAAYYLLPGPYEWESDHNRELRAVFVLPFLVIAGFALASGRLAPWIGHSLSATMAVSGILLLLSFPTWYALPRVLMAAAPTVLLLSGTLEPLLREAHCPIWLAWLLLGSISLILSARLYVFAVMPTLVVCWLLTRFT